MGVEGNESGRQMVEGCGAARMPSCAGRGDIDYEQVAAALAAAVGGGCRDDPHIGYAAFGGRGGAALRKRVGACWEHAFRYGIRALAVHAARWVGCRDI